MTSPTLASAPAPKSSLWEDFVDIFYAPAQVFARRRDGRFGAALAVYAVVSLALFFVFRPMFAAVMEAETARGMAAVVRDNPSLTAEQVAGMRAQGERVAGVLGPASALLAPPLLVLLVGLATWLLGKAAGSTLRYAQAATIATYANLPRLAGAIVSGALFLAGRPERVASQHSIGVSPVRLFDESALPPVATAALARLDLFTLWTTVLLAVGLRVIGGLSKERAALAAAGVWVLATLAAIAGAARQ